MNEEQNKIMKEFALESVISSSIKISGVKVDRKKFLREVFANEDVSVADAIEKGPVAAGISQDKLSHIANKLILKRTSQSSAASFMAGLPGGLAMAATIPADVLQFFGMALRLAQELSYIYGAEDLWINNKVDDEKIQSQLLLYCGVMFGVSGAASGVRVLSTQIAKTTAKKIPQKALTKTLWYPLMKKIGKSVGMTITKKTLGKSVEKIIPVVGGVISGTLNFASMLPMANRLLKTLDEAAFGYTDKEFERDLLELENITEEVEVEVIPKENAKDKLMKNSKKTMEKVSGLFSKKKVDNSESSDDVFEKIEKLSKMKDNGILTQEEFDAKKAELLTKI